MEKGLRSKIRSKHAADVTGGHQSDTSTMTRTLLLSRRTECACHPLFLSKFVDFVDSCDEQTGNYVSFHNNTAVALQAA